MIPYPALEVETPKLAATADIGKTITRSVTPKNGVGPYTYEWYILDKSYNESYISQWDTGFSGQDTDTLSFTLTENDFDENFGHPLHSFKCVVTDFYGNTVESELIWACQTMKVTQQPTSVTAEVGETVKFTATAGGGYTHVNGSPRTYQWQRKLPNGTWTDIDGAVNQSYSFTKTSYLDSFDYVLFRCIISDKHGNSVITNAAYLY